MLRIVLCAAVAMIAAFSCPASAQKTRSALSTVYSSSSAPRHYRRAVAKALRLRAPMFGAWAVPAKTQMVGWSTSRGSQPLPLTCFGTLGDCRRFVLRGLPIGASGSVYAKSGALVKTLTADSHGYLAWDGTIGAANAASGTYTVAVQGAGGSTTFTIVLQ